MAEVINLTDNIPSLNSSDFEWIEWHRALIAKFNNKREANYIFMQAWQKRKSNNANTRSLRTYLKENGIEIETTWFGENITDGISNAFGTITGIFGKVGTGIGILVIVIVVVIAIVLINLSRKPDTIKELAGFLKK